jgi:hypothetical protein
MRQHTRDHTALLPITCFGLVFLFCSSFTKPASLRTAAVSTTTAKCTIDIAGPLPDCTLNKAKNEWISWTNSSANTLSVYFKPNDSPFEPNECWSVPSHKSRKSGKITVGSDPNGHAYYKSTSLCAPKSPYDPKKDKQINTPKVIIE